MHFCINVILLVGLSVDWINNKVYYVDGWFHYIGVVDFTNNVFKRLITNNLGNIEDIIVDPTTRYLIQNTNSCIVHHYIIQSYFTDGSIGMIIFLTESRRLQWMERTELLLSTPTFHLHTV